MRERCGLNKKSIDRIAQKAFDNGVKHSETKGRLHKWITSVWGKNKKADNIRIYGDNVYIFCGNILVTTYHIPRDLSQDMNYLVTRKN